MQRLALLYNAWHCSTCCQHQLAIASTDFPNPHGPTRSQLQPPKNHSEAPMTCVQMRATKSGKQMCVHAKTATYLCTCERSSCFAKGLCEPWLVVPHLCIVSASSWPPEPVFFGPLIGASQPCSPPKLYIPILVNSSVLKRCIREMILASSLLLFQTM